MPTALRTTWTALSAAAAAAALVAGACSTTRHDALPEAAPPMTDVQGTAYEAAARVQLPKVAPEEDPGLHNVFRLSERVVSGSEPHGEDAFRALQAMGVHTILSVDGKVPDAAMAAKYGMRYVHIPIQYKGITDEELLEISKTFREQEGPFYVHCFHGKHRGPAAAAVGRLVLDGVPREQVLAEMRQWCGTAQSYEGLYRVIAEARIPGAKATQAFAFDFPAAHAFQGFRGAMVEISRVEDNVKYLSKHGWKPGEDHPDVDALNEATKLASLFERALKLPELAARPADFRGWMDESVTKSAALREAVRGLQAGSGDAAAADAAYKGLSAVCKSCHDVYRD